MRTAQRRYDDERILRRRLARPHHWWVRLDNRLDEQARARWMGIYRNTGTRCSCWACRTARRYYGPSAQERRQVAWLEGSMTLAQMVDLGYNYTSSNQVVDRGATGIAHGLSKSDRRLTMQDHTSNAPATENKRELRNAEYRARIANDPEYRNKRNEKSRRWRERNRARIAEYNATRYAENPDYLYQATRSYIQRNPERRSAHKAVSYAVKMGKLPPVWTMVCEYCQEAQASHYHHHNGYIGEHRLDVIALCTECHGKAHRVD